MKGGMTVEKKNMSALLGGLANKSEKEQAAKKAAASSGTAYVAKAEDDEKTSCRQTCEIYKEQSTSNNDTCNYSKS